MRVGPSSLTPWNTTTFGEPRGEDRRVEDPGQDRDRRRDPAMSVGDDAWPIPSGASTIAPATIAHAVVRSGEWRRRIGAPKAV